MPTAEAQVPTERASRYLVQLCRHASQMNGHRMARLPAHITRDPQARHGIPSNVNAEWSDTHGTVTIAGGRCTLRATQDTLALRIDADDEDTLHRMEDLITRNLARFSRRDPLTVNWTRPEDPADPPGEHREPAPTAHATTPRHRHRTIALIVIAALAVAAHVILGGAVLSAPQWTGWAANAILAAVLIKLALVGVGYRAHRRRKALRNR